MIQTGGDVDVPGGNFWPQMAFTDYSLGIQTVSSNAMNVIRQSLRAGDGVGIDIYGPGAHAITVWGYSYGSSDTDYRGLWITDSDDGISGIQYYAVSLSNNYWYLQNFCGVSSWFINYVEALSPNHAPTLTTVSPLTGAQEDTPYSINYDFLAASSHISDPDTTHPMFPYRFSKQWYTYRRPSLGYYSLPVTRGKPYLDARCECEWNT